VSKKFIVERHWDFQYIDKQLGRLRQWFEGFREGGGHLAHDFDVLRQCQVIFDAAKPVPSADDVRRAYHELQSAAGNLEEALDAANAAFGRFIEVAENSASGMEAAAAGETVQQGSTEGDSSAPQGETPQ
jgi:hypothetical protein